MSWQTIETAPKDGTLILTYGTPKKHPNLEAEITRPIRVTAYWETIDEAFCVATGDWMGPFISPTHWMPLPEPPTD